MISLLNDKQESIILDDCKILPHIEEKVIEKTHGHWKVFKKDLGGKRLKNGINILKHLVVMT